MIQNTTKKGTFMRWVGSPSDDLIKRLTRYEMEGVVVNEWFFEHV
jgi:hypothetical protein